MLRHTFLSGKQTVFSGNLSFDITARDVYFQNAYISSFQISLNSPPQLIMLLPTGSMYGICTYICLILMVFM